jgi:predicted RNA-binding protein with EMAP domain
MTFTNYYVDLTAQQLEQFRTTPENLTSSELQNIIKSINYRVGEFKVLHLYSSQLVQSKLQSKDSRVVKTWSSFIRLTKLDHELLKKLVKIKYCDIETENKSKAQYTKMLIQLNEFIIEE